MPEKAPGTIADLPLVASLCGTYLKPEMQSIYRQIVNLRDHRTVVMAEQVINRDLYPEPGEVVQMTKRLRPRPKGNFVLRFWYKHLLKQWPPPRPISPPQPTFYPYDLPALLRRYDPALAHVYYGHKAVKYLPMLRAWGGKFIVSFHGVDVVKFMKRKGYAEEMREMLGSASLVLGRSRSLLSAVEGLGCAPEKLRLNHTPIPFEGIPVVARDSPDDGAWRLVQACRLIPKKGLFTTVEAMGEVVKVWPRAKFVLCGTGPVEGRLRDAVTAAGLHDNVELLGWMDQEALLAEFRRSHLFLHPSELTESSDQEGIPNSMLEAMASGLAVVATLHGGIPEAVEDGRDGILVPEKSPGDLATAILRLLGDDKLRSRAGAAAAASVRANFGLPQQVAKLEECYRQAIGTPNPENEA
ncbi:hypothetical protein BH23VER1_BH23VER1_01960 [soil metagenome]